MQLRTKAKIDFVKGFFEVLNILMFGKNLENVTKHQEIRILPTDRKRSYLVEASNYHTTSWFPKTLLAIEINEREVKMKKPVYLGLSILNKRCIH